jgi:hypothetical protein
MAQVAPEKPRESSFQYVSPVVASMSCPRRPRLHIDPPPGSGCPLLGFAHGSSFAEEKESQVTDNIMQMHFQRPRNPQKDIHRRHPKTALNLPHINGIDVNPLGQFFLRQTSQLAVFANTATQELAIFFGNHDWLISQTGNGEM